MFEKWFGARMKPPVAGTFSAAVGPAAIDEDAEPGGDHPHELVDRTRADGSGSTRGSAGTSRRDAPPCSAVRGSASCHVAAGCYPSRAALRPRYATRAPSLASGRPLGAQPPSSSSRSSSPISRLVALGLPPHLADLARGVHRRGRDTGQVGGAEGRCFGHLGDDHRGAQDVGLELHQPAVDDGAAVGAQVAQARIRRPPPARAPRRPSGRRSPPAQRGRGGLGHYPGSGRRSFPARRGPNRASPARSARARSRRRRWSPARRARPSVSSADLITPMPSRKPLDGGAGDEDRRLEGVGGRAIGRAADRRQQPLAGSGQLARPS